MTARIVPYPDPTLSSLLVDFFRRTGSGCYCRYWHFDGDRHAWQALVATNPADNERAWNAAHDRAPVEVTGLAALAENTVIGWAKLVPLASTPKMTSERYYRALLGDVERAWAIACFLVDPAWRKQGIARALAQQAADHVFRLGGESVIGFPRRCEGPLFPEELWRGPLSVFTNAGFEVVAGDPNFPVVRKRVR